MGHTQKSYYLLHGLPDKIAHISKSKVSKPKFSNQMVSGISQDKVWQSSTVFHSFYFFKNSNFSNPCVKVNG